MSAPVYRITKAGELIELHAEEAEYEISRRAAFDAEFDAEREPSRTAGLLLVAAALCVVGLLFWVAASILKLIGGML